MESLTEKVILSAGLMLLKNGVGSGVQGARTLPRGTGDALDLADIPEFILSLPHFSSPKVFSGSNDTDE